MELLGSNIKKFQKTETLLILFSVREIELFSPGNENPEKICYIFLKENVP